MATHDHAKTLELLLGYDKVFFDLDGVMVNWADGVSRLIPDHARRALLCTGATICPHNTLATHLGREVTAVLGVSGNRMWKEVNNAGQEFWARLPVLPEGLALWKGLIQEGRRPTVLTAPAYSPASAAGKMEWMNTHLLEPGQRVFRDFIITAQKGLLAAPGRLLIDDTERNTKAFTKAGGTSMLWPLEGWNGT